MRLPILRRKNQSPPKKWKALSVKPSHHCPSVLCKVLSDGTQIFSFRNLLADEAKQVEQVATKKAHALEESSEGLKGWGLDFELLWFCFPQTKKVKRAWDAALQTISGAAVSTCLALLDVHVLHSLWYIVMIFKGLAFGLLHHFGSKEV